MHWLAIETAPEAGSGAPHLLVWAKGWMRSDIAFRDKDGWKSATDHDGFVFARIEPTHWMPLPEPPI